jgi:hypothetical protein
MSWNYRFVKYPDDGSCDITYGLHEALYKDSEGKGKPLFISKETSGLVFNDKSEIDIYMERIKEALSKPLLDYNTLEEIEWD